MMRVPDIIFCLRADNIEGQGATAHTILTALTPEYVPGLFTFSVVVTILDIDVSEAHELLVQFFAPSGEEVLKVESSLPVVSEVIGNLPMEHKGLNLAMDWNNVDLRVSGLYKICISVDGNMLRYKEIFVKGKNE